MSRPDHDHGRHHVCLLGAARLYRWRLICLTLLGVAPDVYGGALGFMRVSFVGMIFVFGYGMFQALMRGVGQTRIPLVIVLGTVILNFVLDPLFIFGWGPLPAHGVMGAALATLATQALAVVLGIDDLSARPARHPIVVARLSPDPPTSSALSSWASRIDRAVDPRARPDGDVLHRRQFRHLDHRRLWCRLERSCSSSPSRRWACRMAVSTLVGQNMGAGNLERAARMAFLGAAAGFVILIVAGLVAYFLRPHWSRSSCRARRRHRRRRAVHPNHVPRLGRHRHAAMHRRPPSAPPATCWSPW